MEEGCLLGCTCGAAIVERQAGAHARAEEEETPAAGGGGRSTLHDG